MWEGFECLCIERRCELRHRPAVQFVTVIGSAARLLKIMNIMICFPKSQTSDRLIRGTNDRPCRRLNRAAPTFPAFPQPSVYLLTFDNIPRANYASDPMYIMREGAGLLPHRLELNNRPWYPLYPGMLSTCPSPLDPSSGVSFST